MVHDIYDPLDEYAHVFRDKFKQVAEDTLNELVKEANIDITQNKDTCQKIYNTEQNLDSIKSRIKWREFWGVVLGLIMAIAVFIIASMYDQLELYILILVGVVGVGALLLLLLCVLPSIKKHKQESAKLIAKIADFRKIAWEQMAVLNSLFDWDVLTRMMTQTVPRLEFDPYFTTQRLADLEHTYGWDSSFNNERSVLYAHSGLINGNPFVICRTKKMEWGRKIYQGSITITWTTIERDSDGKTYTRHHSQVLTAEVVKPYPNYFEKTRVIYGNTAAPDLIFNRKDNDLAGRENSLAYKWQRRKLRKKARDLQNHDYAMMDNEEFEVLFNTSDRNNNQQFALLFTPLAQQNMLKIMRDEVIGYGDDFDFYKNKMINTIMPQHMQQINVDFNPQQFRHFDFEKLKANFINESQEYFRAIYFSLAPLLCVPMYQQIRPVEAIYGHDMKKRSAFWEHEALANFWGNSKFQHPQCVTDCILKTEQTLGAGNDSQITVKAYGYRTEPRVELVQKYGGDGHWHNVPVHWDEYLPVTGVGQIHIQDDDHQEQANTTHTQRLQHISHILNQADYQLYRRHIASKL